jgi:hypothetical protein
MGASLNLLVKSTMRKNANYRSISGKVWCRVKKSLCIAWSEDSNGYVDERFSSFWGRSAHVHHLLARDEKKNESSGKIRAEETVDPNIKPQSGKTSTRRINLGFLQILRRFSYTTIDEFATFFFKKKEGGSAMCILFLFIWFIKKNGRII